MKINKEIIEKLNPCKNRFDNFLEHYKDFDNNIEDFVLLENISYSDKIWVITNLFTKQQNVKFALKCASSVLHVFEEKYPNDKRPRKAINAAELYLKIIKENNKQLVYYATAAYAAYAAAYAAYAAAAAAAAATAAYAADAAATAAYAAAAAADAAYVAAQQELNLLFAVEIANEKESEDETK
jgi:hypothetical protein